MAERPDIVLFLVDQMRFDQIGWASDGHFPTPNLDRLAARGCVFDTAYSASTVCVPSRVALMTGVHPHRHPTQMNGSALREGFWTLARALRSSGYETAAIGKMHFAPVHADHGFETLRLCEHLDAQGLDLNDPAAQRDSTDDYHHWLEANGIDDWRYEGGRLKQGIGGLTEFPYPPEVHPTGWVEREVLQFLDDRASRADDRPLFLVVSFPHPHAPYNPPEPYASMFDPADSRLPTSGFEVNDSLPRLWSELAREFGGQATPKVDPHDEGPLRCFLATVRGLVKHIDDASGRILERIDLDDSLVFFSSDHGDFSGHRGLMRKNPWFPFEDLSRVPFCVAGRDVVPGRRVVQHVQSFDFVRTALDYAGLDPPAALGMDSCSLRPLLTGADEAERHVFCTTTGFFLVRQGPIKLIRWEGWDSWLLFDLAQDPVESHDFSEDPAYGSVRRELEAVLRAHIDRPVLDVDAGADALR